MKRSIIILLAIIFVCNSFFIYANAMERIDTEEINTEMMDLYLEKIKENDLYDEEKIQKCTSFLDAIDIKHELIRKNSKEMNVNENELFVDNCVILKSAQEIVFDTTNVISAVRYGEKYYIQYDSVENARNAIKILEQYPSVTYAVTDYVISIDEMNVTKDYKSSPLLGKDGYTHLSWGITQTGLDIYADYVSNITTSSINIAVIDTGVDSTHSFLKGHVSNIQRDFVGQDGIANDPNGHGTFVAGIIVDAMQKLNFDIIPVRVLNSEGVGLVSYVADGIIWAVDSGADVINLSLSGPTDNIEHEDMDDAINYAISKNVLVVVAAGNQNDNITERCPAHMPSAIVVSGIDKNKLRQQKSNYGKAVDVAGPAVKIKSCTISASSSTGYGLADGTSFATPHVTAAVAMLRLVYPNVATTAIHSYISQYVDDVGVVGKDDFFGNGLMKISNSIVSVPFTDVKINNYFYDGVYSGYGRGYLSGLNATTFGYASNMQRQDVAVVLYRMAGSPSVTYNQVYSDVSSNDYFAKAVIWAKNHKILLGYENGQLGVGDPITREDFVVVLSRYAQYRGMNVSGYAYLNAYPDYTLVSEYANQAVQWAVKYGIIGNDNYLSPKDNVIRADIAVMIYKFLSL